MALVRHLCYFFIKFQKPTEDGTELEPSTLTPFQRRFGRHLRDSGKPHCLFNDKEFAKSRTTFESKRKNVHLCQQGKGHRPIKALGLNEDEMEKFGQQSTLATTGQNPLSLQCGSTIQ